MKTVMRLLACFVVFNAYAQNEEMKQILSIQNIHISEASSLFSKEIAKESQNRTGILANLLLNTNDIDDNFSDIIAAKHTGQKFVAYSVSITDLNGFNFHVADYYDGTRIVTCLDGQMKGTQGISVNGVQTVENSNPEWYTNYFIHYYQHGKVVSYPNRQTIELY